GQVQYYADGTPAREVQWVYEPGSFRPLAQVERKGEETRLHYVVTDLAGTARELCSETGEVHWRGEQGLWNGHREDRLPVGRKRYLGDAANEEVYCELRYQGQIYDAETGLYYNRHRYYDADSGQYISPDPIGLAGGLRPQGYVHNPLEWVDPLGLTPKEGQSNIVYRALTEQDAARLANGESIQGKALDGNWSAAEHVANQPLSAASNAAGGPAKNSPWISTTKDLDIARSYDSGHGIIEIDLNKVSSPNAEVWKTAPRVNGTGGLPYHRSIWAQEVTVYKEIPNSAIKGLMK
ncbi:RHS repeat-associated core domain-containing protein, partial [Lonsdalea iberica]